MVSLMSTAKSVKISCFWVILMPPQMKSAWKGFDLNGLTSLIKKPKSFKIPILKFIPKFLF